MSSSKPSPSTVPEDGIDVRSTATAFAALAAFAIVAGVVGFQTRYLSLTFAGLPVSAIFTAIGGEFVVAWPIDTAVWIAAAAWPGRHSDPFSRPWLRSILTIVAAALAYGWAIGLLVEPI